MGCGQTLHLMASNMVACLDRDCPDKGAAQKILSDPESEHVVTFGTDSWTIRHPLRERLGDLVACQVHEACRQMAGPPLGMPGTYRARVTATGMDWEPLPLDALPPPEPLPPYASWDPEASRQGLLAQDAPADPEPA